MTNAISPTTNRLSRRDFLKITAASAAALAAGYFWGGRPFAADSPIHQESRLLMGTVINLSVLADNKEQAVTAVAATFAEMERVIGLLDYRPPAAPLARLNREGWLADPPPELLEVVGTAVTYAQLTAGAFDISVKPLLDHLQAGGAAAAFDRTLVDYRQIELSDAAIRLGRPGMALTLDGLGKGFVVDKATAVLHAHGLTNILVEAGGDLVGHGRRPDGSDWQIGVAHPRGNGMIARLPIHNQAAATSGDYQHYFSADFSRHHIIDPRSGQSPAELASVTVTAPAALDADALSTALMVLGLEEGLALANRLPHVSALMVTKSLDLYQTADIT
jgi:thiamine biosynthesis lipoprotein